jgi:hypothetical protein
MTTEKPVRPVRGLAALFDLRLILAVLFGIYGIVVTLMGLLVTNKTVTANGVDIGINVNLWTGIPMLCLGIVFGVWAVARPVVPDQGSAGPSEGPGDGTASPG